MGLHMRAISHCFDILLVLEGCVLASELHASPFGKQGDISYHRSVPLGHTGYCSTNTGIVAVLLLAIVRLISCLQI